MARKDGTLAFLLHAQGFGSRKECARMVHEGRVEVGRAENGGIAWRPGADPAETLVPEGLYLKADGIALPCLDPIHLALHKPAGFECSHSPSHHQSVFSLVPGPWVRRGLQAVGRLDADTTGLLLLSDSGAFNHFFTSPRHHVPKTYRVGTRHPIASDQVERIATGVELRGEEERTLPATVRILGERNCEVTLEEGRYHQVKRMFAAVGNRVESIHRVAIGGLMLGEDLPEGRWRVLTRKDLGLLGYEEAE